MSQSSVCSVLRLPSVIKMTHAVSASSFSDMHCSICWEEVSDACGRTVVKLQCSHSFHLDCIGSAFNATGTMQCPNCRAVENGVWRRFDSCIPETDRSTDDSDDDDDVDPLEMFLQRFNPAYFCSLQGWTRELSLLRYQDVSEQQARVAGDPNSNHSRTGPNERAASHFIHHQHQRNNQFILNSVSAHLSGVGWSVPELLTVNVREDPLSIRNLESVAQPVVLDPGLGAQSSVGSGSGSLGGSNNFRWMYPRRNSPSPPMRHMLVGRRAINDLSGWVLRAGNAAVALEETGRNNYMSPLSISIRNRLQPERDVHRHFQAGDDVVHPEYFRHDNMDQQQHE